MKNITRKQTKSTYRYKKKSYQQINNKINTKFILQESNLIWHIKKNIEEDRIFVVRQAQSLMYLCM